MAGMSRTTQVYAAGVACAGGAACAAAAAYVSRWDYVAGLALCWVALGSISSVRKAKVRVSLAFVVGIAAIFLVGPAGVTLVSLGNGIQFHRPNPPWFKRAFNAAQSALAGGAAGLVYVLLGGPVGHLSRGDFPKVVFVALVCVAVLVAVNVSLVAGVVHLDTGTPFFGVWRGSISWATVSFFAYGMIGLLIATMWEDVNALAALLLLLPLLVARTTYFRWEQQQQAYDDTLRSLIQAVETKDYYTRGHSERVAEASLLIAREVRMREDRVEALRYAGMLHDVGKTGVPTQILQKTGRLDPDEVEAIRQHTTRGFELLRGIDFLDEALTGVYHHHERLDGTGYPLGLAGADIPEFARIIAVADAFDSMTSTRSYRAAQTVEAAIVELVRCKGTQFEPVFVDALVRAIERRGWEPASAPPSSAVAAPEPSAPAVEVPAQAPPVPAYAFEHDA